MSYASFDKYGNSEGADNSETSYVSFSKFNTGGEGDVKMTISSDKEGKESYELIEIQSAQHKKNILTEWAFVVVMIYGKWCAPCKTFKPSFANYAKDYINKIYFALEDVDLGLTPSVTAVPSLIIYKRGNPVKFITGGNLKELHAELMKLTSAGEGQ